MESQIENWYESWFDSPYYHILYRDRNEAEARGFMKKICIHLQLQKGATIMDLACGRGRHAVYLNELGYRVKGLDLSPNSIAFAKQFETESLSFQIHDMRNPYRESFDAVFNLFTSFGYFVDKEEDLSVFKTIKGSLKEGGVAVIDFMNASYVTNHLVAENQKEEEGISFTLRRKFKNGVVYKEIRFLMGETAHSYTERVRAYEKEDLERLCENAELKLVEVFGNYQLDPYQPSRSPRLIMILKWLLIFYLLFLFCLEAC